MLQLYGLNTRDALLNVHREGLLVLYRGLAPPLAQATISKGLMFGLYDWCDNALTQRLGSSTGVHLAAAGLSGASESILAPFEVSERSGLLLVHLILRRLTCYHRRL